MLANGLNITVATAPTGLTLEEEIRLAKPALIYGDRVTLYSPAAMMLASAEHVAALDDDGLVEFMRMASSALGPEAEDMAAYYEALKNKPHRNRGELQEFLKVKRLLRQMAGELQNAVNPMLEEAGAGELAPAIHSGLLTIDPLLTEFSDDQDELVNAFMDKLRDLLTSRSAYPLFDEQVGGLVRAGIDEGMFEIGPTARRRGKNVGVASEFIARVPAFPEASIAEILGVREDLRPPLTRFRSAVSAFSSHVEAAAHEKDFAAEVADIYLAEVEPALQDIREAVDGNTYLKQLSRQAVAGARDALTRGGMIAIGLMGLADAPAVASVVVGAGAAVVQAGSNAARQRADTRTAIERNRLFFLYQAERFIGQ
jgi:hypothetical protein